MRVPDPAPAVWYLEAEQATFRSLLEVFSDTVRSNYEALAAHTGCTVMPILKSDAYGLGLPLVYHALREVDPAWIGVANPWEGLRLRRLGYRGEVLVLSGFLPDEVPLLQQWGLVPAVYHEHHLAWLHVRGSAQVRQRVHVKVDTGMGRIGVPWYAIDRFLTSLRKYPNLEVEGVFTNLACADDPANPLNRLQVDRFRAAADAFVGAGHPVRWRHMANSAACHLLPETHFDLVRPGISLYGWAPRHSSLSLRPALRWWARVLQVRRVRKGESIGYGATRVLDRDRWVAIIGVGYFDGYDRRFSDRAYVLDLQGHRLPVLGRVSMDMTAVALDDSPRVRVGDPVLILGPGTNGGLELDDLAAWCNTTPHEILCRIGPRVSRRLVPGPQGSGAPWPPMPRP